MAVVFKPYKNGMSLEESMDELLVFDTEEDMIEYLKDNIPIDIKVDKETHIKDTRIGWNSTYYIIGQYKYTNFIVGCCDLTSFQHLSRETAKNFTLSIYENYVDKHYS